MSHSNRLDASASAAAGAVDAFRDGRPVLIHDAADREGETDLVYPADVVTPADIARLRNDAGGLVCVALSDAVARVLGLPFLHDAIDHPAAANHDLTYDDRSSFSLPVNHRSTDTGITDADRATTITELATFARRSASVGDDGASADAPDEDEFADAFRTPGHVSILRAAPGLLADRQGHTELGVALAEAAGRPPAVVVCEMLDDETGDALSTADARRYAEHTGMPYVEGSALIDELC